MMHCADLPARDEAVFRRVAAATTLVAAGLSLTVVPVGLAAVGGDLTAGLDGQLVPGAVPDAGLQRLSNILDMFGYYLLLTPIALYLLTWLGPRKPQLARFATLCGLTYMLVGACGAAVLAAVQPPLLAEYAQASGARREIIEVVYRTVWAAVGGGLWDTLEAIPASIWWIGIGLLLRTEHRRLAVFTILLGALALVDSVGTITGIQVLGPKGLGFAWVLLAPGWAAWAGLVLARQRPHTATVNPPVRLAAPSVPARAGS